MSSIRDLEREAAFRGEAADAMPTPYYQFSSPDYYQMLNLLLFSSAIRGDAAGRARALVIEQYKLQKLTA